MLVATNTIPVNLLRFVLMVKIFTVFNYSISSAGILQQ